MLTGYPGGLYEFHMHYRPPADWTCLCHVKKAIRVPPRGVSHFAPDDYVSCHRVVPIRFDGYDLAQKWWIANREDIVKSIEPPEWSLLESDTRLIEVVEKPDLMYPVYQRATTYWVDVWERVSCCDSFTKHYSEYRMEFDDLESAKIAILNHSHKP